jgi:NitT/TauT family transport system permease protein
MRSPTISRLEPVLLPLGVTAILVALWHWYVVASGTKIIPTPAAVVLGIGELWQSDLLAKYVFASLFRVFVGFSLALAVGVPLGLLMGWFDRVYYALNPLVQVLRPISPIAWIPLAILAFGVSDAAPISLIFLASLFPITTTTVAAVRNISTAHLRAARNFGVGGMTLFTTILLPAALPQIIIGVRIALGVAWLVVVAAEMIAVTSGLGYLIIDSRNAGNEYDLVIAGMLLIGLIGLALDFAVRWFERLEVVRWGFHEGRN